MFHSGPASRRITFLIVQLSCHIYLFIYFLFLFLDTFQISEVVNSMKDLIDYSRNTGTGPMGELHVIFSSFNFLLVVIL